jgi:hypothetical protein
MTLSFAVDDGAAWTASEPFTELGSLSRSTRERDGFASCGLTAEISCALFGACCSAQIVDRVAAALDGASRGHDFLPAVDDGAI